MRNDFDDREESQDEDDLEFSKSTKSAVLEADEDESADVISADDADFEADTVSFDDAEEVESPFALYEAEEDELGLQY